MRTTTPKISDWRVSWTADHEQYWQGHGTAFTDYTHCATGCGETLREAFNDAIDQLFQGSDCVFADEKQEAEMLSDLESQVKDPAMLDWDIVKAKCPEQGSHSVVCPQCEGIGLEDESIPSVDGDDCPTCHGEHEIIDENPDCAVCAGEWHFYVNVDVRLESEEQ